VTGLLIHDCVVDGHGRTDVRIRDGNMVEVAPALRRDGEEMLSAGGGALISGLHDHHLHLFALAADLSSVRCGPENIRDAGELARELRSAAAQGPVRGTGYHESVAGSLDRDRLDGFVADVPVRVQHRSGAAWFLNSAALTVSGLANSPEPAVERDGRGRPTGRLLRGDHLLPRDDGLPDLAPVGSLLATYGVIGVTDATPRQDARQIAALRAAHDEGLLPQRPLLLGTPLDDKDSVDVPWKILVDEVRGIDPDALLAEMYTAHAAGRPVALHCTSRAETVLAVALLRDCGPRRGDRLEHASVLPREFDRQLARDGVTVVTQPNFIAERGDDYLVDVEAADHDLLYRCGSLSDAGVPVAAGTDAPYGDPDPWRAIAAAVNRRTRNGAVIGRAEHVPARRALELFLGDPLTPGGRPRRAARGAPADLCLLSAPLSEALEDPQSQLVAATVIAGTVTHRTR
jgi:predicted amidohydrolase YtcJ